MIDSTIPDEAGRRQNRSGSDWLAGGGEMGERIRSFEWAQTPIGPVELWSPALRTMVSILLANRFPLLLWWGPQYVSIYNDAYRPILGAKHPWALGQPVSTCWSEIWHILQPLIDTPFNGGPATWNDDILLEINRRGFVEETHFTIAYSPVPDESASTGIGGVLATVHEITEKVVGERRVIALRDLGAEATVAKTAEEACAIAAETLSRHAKDIPFAVLYLIDADGKRVRLAGAAGVTAGGRGSEPIVELGADAEHPQPWPLSRVIRTETMQVIEDVSDGFGGAVPPGPWSDPPRQGVVVPIRSNIAHQPAGILLVGVSARLKFDELYRSFYEFLAGQIATAIANARAHEDERKRAEALAEIDRAKTTFFSNVSHEFRTPLTLMLGPLEDELRERPGAPRLELAHRNSLRLLKLVNTLLDFSRLEADRMQAYFEPTDLGAFTAELASVFRSAIERAGLRLVVDCPAMAEPVYVDRVMWEKVVLNLMSNALKFTFEGEIEVTLKEVGTSTPHSPLSIPHVELRIRDTGEGISEEDMPHLFERFYRVENTRSRTHEGSGIGLALVHELIKLHGGSVRVESRLGQAARPTGRAPVPAGAGRVGETITTGEGGCEQSGSVFIVTVPLGTAHLPADRIGTGHVLASAATNARPFVEEALRWLPDDNCAECSVLSDELSTIPNAESGSEEFHLQDSALISQHSRPRVLVADDNADMRDYVRRLLAERYDVVAVADGKAALERIKGQPPDLVLSDVMMPRLDGFGLLRELRADVTTKTIPVILLSARAGEESRVEGLQQGADDYLIKPFSARELLARVSAHLDMARLRREAEGALRQSEERFTRFMQHFPGLAWIKDAQGRYTYANDAAQKAFQTPQERLYGKTDEEIFAAEVAAQFRENDRRALASGTGVQVVETLEHQDGLFHHSIVSKFPIPGPDGQTTLIGGMAIDITERNRDKEAKARLAAIVESSDDAIILLGLDGVITTWNAGAERLFGYTAQEAVGRHITMLMPPERLHEEAVILGRIRRGERIEHYETMRQRKDGTLLDISLSVSPVTDSSGKIVGASKIARDITDRKKQELALITRGRQQRLLYQLANTVNRAGALAELYEKALDTIISALHADRASILLFDDDGIMRFKALRGLSEDYRRAVEGHSPWKRDTPDPRAIVVGNIDEAEIAPDLQEVIRGEGIHAFCFIPLMYGGRLIGKFMVYFNRPRMMNEEEINLAHAIAGTLALGIERKAGEEALRRLNDELEARIDDRTRDLVTSQERLRALATELNLTEQRERQRLATELHDYLAQLLALSKIKVAQVKQQPATPAVAKLLNEMQEVLDKALTYTRTLVAELSPPVLQEFGLLLALQWLAEQMKVHGLTVALDAEGALSPISEDQARLLFQSVRELLINITKHGQIDCATVQVRQTEEKLRIAVIDEGAGFDLAAAAAAAGTVISHSSKFGLFSIRERMIALGGEFHIASAVGQGTTATVVLPLAGAGPGQSAELRVLSSELAESATPAALSTQNSELHQNAVIRVLLVDDHAMVRQGLRGLLNAHADITIVGEAATGEEALALSGELEPHVVLMDVNMPGMGGVQSTRRITQASPAVKVIGLSIQEGEEVKTAMKKAGAVGFLNKEAAVDKLYSAIRDAVRDHSADGKP